MRLEIAPFEFRTIPLPTFHWLLSTNQIVPITYYLNDEIQETTWRTIHCDKQYR